MLLIVIQFIVVGVQTDQCDYAQPLDTRFHWLFADIGLLLLYIGEAVLRFRDIGIIWIIAIRLAIAMPPNRVVEQGQFKLHRLERREDAVH